MQDFFFSITWLVPVFPFLAFLIIILFTQNNNKLSQANIPFTFQFPGSQPEQQILRLDTRLIH